MAKAVINKRVERVVVEQEENVTLVMSLDEARMLRDVVGQFNYGGKMNPIYDALEDAGVRRFGKGYEVHVGHSGGYAGTLTLQPRK